MIALLAAALSSPVFAAELDPKVEQAEALWVESRYEESNALLDQRLAENPDDVEALWRKARNLYNIGEVMASQGKEDERLPLYQEMERLTQHLLEVDPGNGEGLHWYGTSLGRQATTKGILASLFMADDIESAWLKGVQDDYTYRAANDHSSFPGDTYYALGQFYRLCPDWALVKILTGTKGDIDKSIAWLQKAWADAPRIEVAKELGVSYLCKADRQDDSAAAAQGRIWLEKAKTMPVVTKSDEIDIRQIPVILERADDACGYSRDGWEDLSRDAYDKQKK